MSSVLTLLSGGAGLWIVCVLLVLLMAAYLIGYSRGHEDGGDEALGRHIMRPTDTLPTVRHDVPVVRSVPLDLDDPADLEAAVGYRALLRASVRAQIPRCEGAASESPFGLVLPDEAPAAYLEPEARPWVPAERKLQDVS